MLSRFVFNLNLISPDGANDMEIMDEQWKTILEIIMEGHGEFKINTRLKD